MELYRITRDKEYVELAKLAFEFIKELQQNPKLRTYKN
jgi:hypothetical protein